jgi:hypothetical protein
MARNRGGWHLLTQRAPYFAVLFLKAENALEELDGLIRNKSDQISTNWASCGAAKKTAYLWIIFFDPSYSCNLCETG